MYSAVLLDHFQNPRNAGELDPPAISVEVSNPACGDILRLSARFQDDILQEVAFKVRGCTASIAAASMLTELVKGKHRKELQPITTKTIEDALGGLPAGSGHAASLAVDGLRRLLQQPMK